MSRKYFGTDGVRGRVGEAPITPDFVMKLGYAAGKVLSRADVAPPHRDRPAVLIGKDTRISGYMLESALEAGLSAAGVDMLLVGPDADAGRRLPHARAAAVGGHRDLRLAQSRSRTTASSSSPPTATKLPDAVESEIEALLDEPMTLPASSAQLGKAERVHDAEGRYIEFCKSTFPKQLDLRGLKLVVDCAHGANYRVGAARLPGAGRRGGRDRRPAQRHQHQRRRAAPPRPRRWPRAVVEHQADFGIAFDGDGDRLVMADRDGTLFDGDQLLYAIVKHRHAARAGCAAASSAR